MKTMLTSCTGIALLIAELLSARAADDSTIQEAPANGTATSRSTFLVADFEKGRPKTEADVPWVIFTDESLGGKSSAQILVTDRGAHGSRHAMLMAGKLTPDFQWGGFVGDRAALREDEASQDMSAYSGVQFYARGDGRTYRLLIGKAAVKDSNHFYAEFQAPTDWKLIRISFSKLGQSPYFGAQVKWSPKDVTAVGFMVMAEPGATTNVKLDVDDVAFFAGNSAKEH